MSSLQVGCSKSTSDPRLFFKLFWVFWCVLRQGSPWDFHLARVWCLWSLSCIIVPWYVTSVNQQSTSWVALTLLRHKSMHSLKAAFAPALVSEIEWEVIAMNVRCKNDSYLSFGIHLNLYLVAKIMKIFGLTIDIVNFLHGKCPKFAITVYPEYGWRENETTPKVSLSWNFRGTLFT